MLRFVRLLTHVYHTSDSIDYDRRFDVYYNMYIRGILIYSHNPIFDQKNKNQQRIDIRLDIGDFFRDHH